MFLFIYLYLFFKYAPGLSVQNIYDVTCYFRFDKGEAYNGTVNTTVTGEACINWKTFHSIYTPYYADHNYCRNPQLDIASYREFHYYQPWCYTDYQYRTGLCNIPACECISSRFGSKCEQICHCKEPGCDTLTGHCNNTECENGWTGDSCNICLPNRFGQNCERVCHCQHGECNNITGVCYNPGCMKGWTGHSCNYTTDCVLKTHDTTYNGTVNITQSNLPCKRWENTESKYYHAFEENFCRNPFFDALDYPWCFTQSGNPRYDVCAIPLCVCQPGRFGENCRNECHCAVDGCDTITGECNNLTVGCKVPWTGRNCLTLFSCPDLQIGSTGQLTPTIGTGYHINDTVKFLCDVSYAVSGPDTLICIINDKHTGGNWNSNQPVCRRIRCSKTSLYLTSNEVMNETTEIFYYGEVVNISCKHGFIGETKKLKCVDINKWNSNRPVCRECISNRFGPKCDKHCHCQLGGCDYKTGVCDKPGCAKDWEGASCNFNKSGSHTIPVEKDGIYMSYGLFGGVLTTIVLISAGVYIGVCFYHRRRVRKHISIYEDLQFKSVQRQAVNNDDTYVELQ